MNSEIKTYKNEMGSIIKKINRYAKCFAIIGVSEVEDIAQDALIKVLMCKDERSPTSPWLYMIVRCTAYDLGRKYRRKVNLMSRLSERHLTGSVYDYADENGVAGGCQNDSEENEPEYSMDTIKFVLEQLSPSHREVLTLYANGWEYADIAASTSTKLGTVRSRLHYARRKAWQILKAVS